MRCTDYLLSRLDGYTYDTRDCDNTFVISGSDLALYVCALVNENTGGYSAIAVVFPGKAVFLSSIVLQLYKHDVDLAGSKVIHLIVQISYSE